MRQFFSFGANLEFVECLVKHSVRFIVVGGLAVQYWVPEREVDDLDLLIEVTRDNCCRLLKVLKELRLTPEFSLEAFLTSSKKQIPIKHHYYLDLVTHGSDIDFSLEWQRAQPAFLGRAEVRFAAVELLLQLKQSSERDKDRNDVRCLNRRLVI